MQKNFIFFDFFPNILLYYYYYYIYFFLLAIFFFFKMKYGEFLQSQIVPEWKDYYLDYEKLKNIIKILEEQFVTVHAPTKG